MGAGDLFQHNLLDKVHGAVIRGEEGVAGEVGVDFFHEEVPLEVELVAHDGGAEGDVEFARAEEALEGEGGCAGAGVPGFIYPMRIQPGGEFHGFDVAGYNLFHADGFFACEAYVVEL